MNNNKDKNSIGKVSSTKTSDSVEKAQNISNVSGIKEIKSAKGVGAVKSATSISGKTLSLNGISKAQHAKILSIIDEEAEKRAKTGLIPKSKKDMIKKSVMMAVDAAVVLKEE